MVETRNLGQYAEIHASKQYGAGGALKERLLTPWILLRRPTSILDYGAGQNRMVERFQGIAVRHRFDPAIPEIATIPLPRYDLIVCTDVLEHLDDSEIGAVLADIRSHCDNALFLVDTRPARTVLPSGENAHATVQPAQWWTERVRQHFPDAGLITGANDKAFIRTWHISLTSRVIGMLR